MALRDTQASRVLPLPLHRETLIWARKWASRDHVLAITPGAALCVNTPPPSLRSVSIPCFACLYLPEPRSRG